MLLCVPQCMYGINANYEQQESVTELKPHNVFNPFDAAGLAHFLPSILGLFQFKFWEPPLHLGLSYFSVCLQVSALTFPLSTAACGAWVQLPVPHRSQSPPRRHSRVSTWTGWPTAGSRSAWAPSRQSTSTTTRPSPLSPTKSHLSSSRKSPPRIRVLSIGC